MNYPNVIAYIDGYNLYYGLREAGLRWAYWLNLQSLSQKYLMPGQSLIHTNYFTTIVSSPPDKRKRQTTYLEALQTLSDFSFFYGHFLADTVTCPSCGYSYPTHHEKMTDVNIAVRLLTDAYQDKFDVAILISADSDLRSAIETIHQIKPAKKVIVVFPPGRGSKELIRVSDGYKHMDPKILTNSLFPNQVKKANGFILRRPQTWK